MDFHEQSCSSYSVHPNCPQLVTKFSNSIAHRGQLSSEPPYSTPCFPEAHGPRDNLTTMGLASMVSIVFYGNIKLSRAPLVLQTVHFMFLSSLLCSFPTRILSPIKMQVILNSQCYFEDQENVYKVLIIVLESTSAV